MNQQTSNRPRGADYWRFLIGWTFALIGLAILLGWIGVLLARATGWRYFTNLPFLLMGFGGFWLRRLLQARGWND